MELILLDGRRMTGREEAHEYLKRAMRLPPYYGNNLDALADCLAELSSEVYVVLYNISDLCASLGEYGDKLLALFREQSGQEHAFHFILQE